MRAKLKWAIPVALACGAAALVLLRTPKDGAQYAGRDLTDWVWDGVYSRRPDAEHAIVTILTNHCEAVVRRIGHEPNALEQKKLRLLARLPTSISRLRFVGWLLGFNAKQERDYCATIAFAYSGPAAKIVTAQLEQLSSPTNSLCRQAVKGLAYVGPEAEAALIRIVTNRAHPGRLQAIYGFMVQRTNSEQVQLILTGLLNDPDPNMRREAQNALLLVKSRIGQ